MKTQVDTHELTNNGADVDWSDVQDHWDTGRHGSFSGMADNEICYRSFSRDNQAGAIVISSGRTECMLKYQETIFELCTREGYSVYILDHRGQGFSGRMLDDPQKGHVEEFHDYVHDFNTFVTTIVEPSQQDISGANKLYLLAHSMGGCIASLYLEEHPHHQFRAAALCSPMHQPKAGPWFVPEMLVDKVSDFKSVFSKRNEFVRNRGPYRNISFQEIGREIEDGYPKWALTHDEGRYERVRQLYDEAPQSVTIGGPTYNWAKQAIDAAQQSRSQAGEIRIPLILLQAGGDTVVEPAGHDEFARNAVDCDLIRINGAYHELLIESDRYRQKALRHVLGFFRDN